MTTRRLYLRGQMFCRADGYFIVWTIFAVWRNCRRIFHTLLRSGHPAGALSMLSVAVLGQDGLLYIRARKVIVEDFIHCDGDALENVALKNPFVVVGGGRGDGEIVTLVAVPFGVNAVQREGQDGQHIGGDGGLGPGGVYLAGGHIFDIIAERYVIILSRGVGGNSVVDNDKFRYNNLAQDNTSGVPDGLDFRLSNFGRILVVKGVRGNHDGIGAAGAFLNGSQSRHLKGCCRR